MCDELEDDSSPSCLRTAVDFDFIFGSTDVLRARVSVFFALGGVVTRESTPKALSFTDAFGPFSGGKFGQSDGIDIHGIRVRGGSRGG